MGNIEYFIDKLQIWQNSLAKTDYLDTSFIFINILKNVSYSFFRHKSLNVELGSFRDFCQTERKSNLKEGGGKLSS